MTNTIKKNRNFFITNPKVSEVFVCQNTPPLIWRKSNQFGVKVLLNMLLVKPQVLTIKQSAHIKKQKTIECTIGQFLLWIQESLLQTISRFSLDLTCGKWSRLLQRHSSMPPCMHAEITVFFNQLCFIPCFASWCQWWSFLFGEKIHALEVSDSWWQFWNIVYLWIFLLCFVAARGNEDECGSASLALWAEL